MKLLFLLLLPNIIFAEIAFYKDIQPIVSKSCTICHNTNSLAAYFPLTHPDNFIKNKDHIKEYVKNDLMPPWVVARGRHEFKFDFSLKPKEKKKLLSWLSQDSPKVGKFEQAIKPKYNPYSVSSIKIKDPDVSFYAPRYKPKPRSSEFRCYLMPWPLKEKSFIVDYTTNKKPLFVHHSIVSKVKGRPKKFTEEEMKNGFECGSGKTGYRFEDPQLIFTGFQHLFFDGAGIEVNPGDYLLFQYHIEASHLSEVEGTIQDFYFKTSKEVKRELYNRILHIPEPTILVKANQKKTFKRKIKLKELLGDETANIKLLSIRPHAHRLFYEGGVNLIKADGSKEELLKAITNIARNSDMFAFKEPIEISREDILEYYCSYDNTDSNPIRPMQDGKSMDVKGGWFVHDEMCIFSVYFYKPEKI